MSIDKVEVTNLRGDLLTLTLGDTSNGYLVKEIVGLDPVKASVVTSRFATRDGEQYQSSSRGTRNIIISLGYQPDFSIDQTVRQLRTALYPFFMTKTMVTLTFYMTDGLVVDILGEVESAEAPLFAKDPAIDISIICFDPDFIGHIPVQYHSTFTTTDSAPHTIDVDGSVPTGLTLLTFTAARTLSEFTIYHTTPAGELRTMLVSAPLVVGDVIKLVTVEGEKSITRTRTGVTTSLLYAVAPQSSWIELEPGPNQFYLNASSTNPSSVQIDFNNRYGGL
jgi:tail protein